jgi:hypothetical protein
MTKKVTVTLEEDGPLDIVYETYTSDGWRQSATMHLLNKGDTRTVVVHGFQRISVQEDAYSL